MIKEYSEGNYCIEELEDIAEWWRSHREYAVNEYPDHIEIVKRLQADLDAEEIRELQCYLGSTDYVTLKLAEAKLDEDDVKLAELRTKYGGVLKRRADARKRINELKIRLGS